MPGHRLTQQPQTVSWSSLESQKSAKEQGSIQFKRAMSSSSQSTWEATKGFSFQTPGCKWSLAAFPSPESTSLLGLVTMTLAELPTALATKHCWEMSTMPWVYNTALKCHLSHLSIQGATVEEATGSLSSVIYSLVKSFNIKSSALQQIQELWHSQPKSGVLPEQGIRDTGTLCIGQNTQKSMFAMPP